MENNIFAELEWRGLIAGATEGLLTLPADKEMTLYCGFDPTASSLHVGHLEALITLGRFQRFGHTPIVIAGGATGMIGDPSGRSAERNLLSEAEIEANLTGIKRQMAGFLDFDNAQNPALMLNNAYWLSALTMLDFLRDVGKHFSVNMMLGKESVRSRLDRETGLSFTEFSYMLLQAYDFLFLNKHYNCDLQIGGTDQWGNILAGIDLIRKVNGRQTHGLVMPLVAKADGSKFGKTEADTVWLSPQLTSPFQFFQFWRNTDDRDVLSYLKRFTWLGQDEIADLEQSLVNNPEQRRAQHVLACELTERVHGKEAVTRAEKTADALFRGELKELSADNISDVFHGVPTIEINSAELDENGLGITTLLARSSLVRSKADAQRMIQGGGIYINDQRVNNTERTISQADLLAGQFVILRKGRKNNHLVRVVT